MNITLNKIDVRETWESLGQPPDHVLKTNALKYEAEIKLKVKKKALFGLMVFS